jgi:hypothetical protein
MFIGEPIRPLTVLEDLELRRERLVELISLGLVSPTLNIQIRKAVLHLDQEITALKNKVQKRAAA